MPTITKFTTPTIGFNLPFNISYLSKAYVTLVQKPVVIEKTIDDCVLDGTTISVNLTQEETGRLESGWMVKVQLRCLTNDGKAYASQEFRMEVVGTLKEGVI